MAVWRAKLALVIDREMRLADLRSSWVWTWRYFDWSVEMLAS